MLDCYSEQKYVLQYVLKIYRYFKIKLIYSQQTLTTLLTAKILEIHRMFFFNIKIVQNGCK